MIRLPREITKNQQAILAALLRQDNLSSSSAHGEISKRGINVSLITAKRELSALKLVGLIRSSGKGRAVKYSVTPLGRILSEVDAKSYVSVEPDKRYGSRGYNFDFFENLPSELFFEEELKTIDEATRQYGKRAAALSPTLREKELERFIIELSWKSSKIEGNTYTLLDTEKLIKEGVPAPGHGKNEARMILNHKEAFKFIRENPSHFRKLTLAGIEEIHKIIVRELNVNYGLRSKPVGVTGSAYRPLDNIHQIKEAMEKMCAAANKMESAYSKAMIALLGLSYIQPFEDGNKRTSRLTANAILLSHEHSPLSYRSVDENEYREAVLVFYELNSIIPFKKIFKEQYLFSAENYAVA